MIQTTAPIAFKEWASVVQALAAGEQILILRKGGIHEKGKQFKVEHDAFFLFPTYEHQKEEDLNARGQELLKQVRSTPALMDSAKITFQYFAEVKESFWIENFEHLMKFASFHVWSENALRKRYTWGQEQGVYALVVRVYRLKEEQVVENLPAYGGCRSWVEIKSPLSRASLVPVLDDQVFESKLKALQSAL